MVAINWNGWSGSIGITGRDHRNAHAEETHALLNNFFAAVDDVVGNYGGSIDKHIGDAVMAVFGAPVAHTDDPERALRAALDIHHAVAQLDPPLRVHIGVASGQVVASSTGSAAHTEYTVTGDSVTLAARLTDLAKAGETLVSASVRRALGERFAGIYLGERVIAGLPEPVAVWQFNELGAQRPDTSHAFVGRQREFRQFSAALEHCLEAGQGETVIVRGEAGIGKTRLVEEFANLANAKSFAVHTGLVLDFGTAKGQDAVRALVRSLLDLAPGSDKAVRAAAADEAVSAGQLPDTRCVHLNDLLDLQQPPELNSIYQAMDNETRNRGKQDTVGDLVRQASRSSPLLLRVEDAHWADPVILAHLMHLTQAVVDIPVLLIVTTRITGDQLDQNWRAGTEGAPITMIELGPLRASEANDLARDFEALNDDVIAACVERSGGNPLFLEQLLRNADELTAGDIPGTIQGIVQARLDALPSHDREAIQAASILGQRFSRSALDALLEGNGYDPANLLKNVLIRPAGDDYHFAHALIRDGVYASLLKPRRIELHGRAVEWFRGTDLILYAEHLDRAEDRRAVEAYHDAAKQQAEAFRYDTAFRLIERALKLDSEPETRFELACTHGDLLRDLGHTEDSISAFQQALEMARNDDQVCRANIGLAGSMRIVDRLDDAFDALDEAEKRAGSIASHLAPIHYLRGNCHFPFGRSSQCLKEHRKALEYAHDAQLIGLEGQALSGISDALYIGRHFSQWRENLAKCLAFSEEHQLHALRASTLFMRATSSIWHLALYDTVKDAKKSAVIAQQIGDKRSESLAEAVATIGQYYNGDFDNVAVSARRSLALADEIGAQRLSSVALVIVAKTSFIQGRQLEAENAAKQALAAARKSGITFYGGATLGTLALITREPKIRNQALQEGHELLGGGCHVTNYLEFRRDAAEIAIECGDWSEALKQIKAWEFDFADEFPPYAEFWSSWIKALVKFGKGERDQQLFDELNRLKDVANSGGVKVALPRIDAALAEFGA